MLTDYHEILRKTDSAKGEKKKWMTRGIICMRNKQMTNYRETAEQRKANDQKWLFWLCLLFWLGANKYSVTEISQLNSIKDDIHAIKILK